MSVVISQLISAGAFFLFIFISGFWLRFSGKPYNTLGITLHKLIGVAIGVYLGLRVYEVAQESPLGSVVIISIAVTVLLFVGLVATGSLLSAEREMPEVVKGFHRALPYLTALSTGITVYLLQ
jgi:hypothetical protein